MSLANTSDMPPKATNPLWKRIKRVLIGLLVSGIVLGGLIAVILASRPPWHTVTGNGKPGEWVGSVECPEDWQLEADKNIPLMAAFADMKVRRKPPTGIWAWWNQHVLHQSVDREPVEISLFLMPEPRFEVVGMPPAPKMDRAERISHAQTLLDNFEFGYKAVSNPQMKFAMKRVSHPLGPALEVSYGYGSPSGGGGGSNGISPGLQYESLCIAPTEAGDFTGTVTVTYYTVPGDAATLKPILERMTRSIRLVKK